MNRSELPSTDRLAYLLTGELAEGDVPLWRVVEKLDEMAPAAPLVDKIRLSRRAVSRLGDDVDLWRGDLNGALLAPLTEAETQHLGADDTLWHDPEGATFLVWLHRA